MVTTVAAAYGTYIVADEIAGASGVLAVVGLGEPLKRESQSRTATHAKCHACRPSDLLQYTILCP